MIIDIDKKTIMIVDSPILISELLDKLKEINIDYNEYRIVGFIPFKPKPKNDNGLLPYPNGTGDCINLPYYPEPNKITVSY